MMGCRGSDYTHGTSATIAAEGEGFKVLLASSALLASMLPPPGGAVLHVV
jgi:hypothetical protein